MKVLAISHSCVTDVNQQLYVALSRRPNVQVSLVVPANWKSEYSRKTLTPGRLSGVKFPIHALPVAAAGHNSLHFYSPQLDAVVREYAPDVVFLDEEPWSLAAGQVAGLCRRLRVPLVCYTKQNINKRYPALFRGIEQNTYRCSSAIAALSEEVQRVLRQKGFAGCSPLLAHGCDLELFYEGDSQSLRETLGLRGLVVGTMGRFVPEKGLDTLLAALPILAQENPAVKMTALLVGSGPEEVALRQAAAHAHIPVVFAGAVPHRNAGEYLRCMDILVVPSRTVPAWKEQFGRVIVEALACGIPVVGSSSGQIPLLIEEAGGGLAFQENSAEDLARQLSFLVHDPATRMRLGRTGQASVCRNFTYEAVAAQLQDILSRAMNSQAETARLI